MFPAVGSGVQHDGARTGERGEFAVNHAAPRHDGFQAFSGGVWPRVVAVRASNPSSEKVLIISQPCDGDDSWTFCISFFVAPPWAMNSVRIVQPTEPVAVSGDDPLDEVVRAPINSSIIEQSSDCLSLSFIIITLRRSFVGQALGHCTRTGGRTRLVTERELDDRGR